MLKNAEKTAESGDLAQKGANEGEASDHEDTPEAVCIDIALGDDRHRITLLPDSDPQQLADDFASEHGLDEKLRKKLTQQLIDNKNDNFGC